MAKFTNEAAFTVFNALLAKHAEGKSLLWSDIVAAINAANLNVTNWMKVRAVLQWFIDNGKLKRDVTDLGVERYEVKQ